MQDVTFFKHDSSSNLRQVSRQATDETILTAHSATLKLDNQKNGWKGVCVHQEANGEAYNCPVRALGRRFSHIRVHARTPTTYLSAFFVASTQFNVMDSDIGKSVKAALPKSFTIQHTKEYQLSASTLTLYEAAEPTLSPYLDILTEKSKKWYGGAAPRSRNISAKNLRVSPLE